MEKAKCGGHVSDELISDDVSDEGDVKWIAGDNMKNADKSDDSANDSSDELVLQSSKEGMIMIGN